MTNDRLFSAALKPSLTEMPGSPVGFDFYGLQEHLVLCRGRGGRFYDLKYAFNRTRSFVFSRIVTTATGILIIFGVSYLLV